MHCHIFTKSQIISGKTKLKPGNFIVTHGNDLFDQIIHIFTMSSWNHAALITDTEGNVVELVLGGIKKRKISEYHHTDFYVVDVEMKQEDREQVVAYAKYMLTKHAKYGFLTILSIILKIITKSRLVIKLDGTFICSEFVARALAQGGIIWDKDPSLLTPADLYNKFIRNLKSSTENTSTG